MFFSNDEIIKDKLGENRWQVIENVKKYKWYQKWKVKDLKEGMRERTFNLYTLNYPDNISREEITTLQQYFLDSAKLATQLHGLVAEPIDLIHFKNSEIISNSDGDDIGVICYVPEGKVPNLLYKNKRDQTIFKIQLHDAINKFCSLFINLSKEGVVLQELNPENIRLAKDTYSLIIEFTPFLISSKEYWGNNPNEMRPIPEKLFSSPESFITGGKPSSQSDMYAFTKYLINLLSRNSITKQNPFPDDIQNIINNLAVDEPIKRALSVATNKNPDSRFNDWFEFRGMIIQSRNHNQSKNSNSSNPMKKSEENFYNQIRNHNQSKNSNLPDLTKKSVENYCIIDDAIKIIDDVISAFFGNSSNATKKSSVASVKSKEYMPLILWEPNLFNNYEFRTKFNFNKLIKTKPEYEFYSKYYFTTWRSDPNNPFFNFLKNKIGFNLIHMGNDPNWDYYINFIINELSQQTYSRVMIVGNGDFVPVDTLFNSFPNSIFVNSGNQVFYSGDIWDASPFMFKFNKRK